MKKTDFLRRKYPRFIYDSYNWKISGKDLEISFDFKIESAEDSPPYIYFKPKLIIKNIDKNQVKRVGDGVLNNLVFNLGLIEMLSYWKATCSPEIEILAGSLNQEQIKWWKDLIDRGMGQFFYENKIDFKKPNFLKFNTTQTGNNVTLPGNVTLKEKEVLIPIGGGKDSIVTLEMLKGVKKNIACFSLNPTEAAKKIMKLARLPAPRAQASGGQAGCRTPIIVERNIDPKLLELNQKGFLNGHTPFSAYLTFLSVLVAVLFGFKFIAFSNERSSNEGNVNYLGRIINHQYSKSFDFEKKFRKYSLKYLTPEVQYFSFLRPLYEIQIAKLFSKYPQYFNAFLSCNVAYQTASGTKKPTNPVQIASRLYGARKWCGRCPKCLFVFTALYPFIGNKIIKIFGKNLFEDRKLLPLMLRLIGKEKFKPFECVGTKKESLVAFYLSWKKNRGRASDKLPFLLKYFEKSILPKYPNLEKESKKLIKSWNNRNNLPKGFKKILKNNIFR